MNPKLGLVVSAVISALSGCTTLEDKWNLREEYVYASDNYAVLELAARDKFRNSDQITVSIVTRTSCDERPEIRKAIHLYSEYDWLLRDKSTYSKSARIEGDAVHTLRLWATSNAPYFMPECGNQASWHFEAGEHYVLEVRNWSSGGKSGTEHGGFGCEWSLVNSSTSEPLPEVADPNFI